VADPAGAQIGLPLSASVGICGAVANQHDIERRIAVSRQLVAGQADLMHREFGRARVDIKHDGTRVTAADIAISPATSSSARSWRPARSRCR
jgi:hypothetical protein